MEPELSSFYGVYSEESRLAAGVGRLEFERTLDILGRFLPPPPARVLDVGGGPGLYSCRLALQGYRVRLVDAVARHLEQARAASARQPSSPVERIAAGDARSLPPGDATQDAVLLMGPLYHLPEPGDRAQALREARRVLKAGGVLAAAAISRFASLLDGLARGFIDDPAFVAILQEDLASGRHRNPTGNLEYFTTAYFHRPEELAAEVAAAGFRDVRVLAVQGPGWIAPGLDARLSDPDRRARLMDILRDVETSPASLAMTPHLVAVAGAPGGRS